MSRVIQTLRDQHQDILARLDRREDLLSIIDFVEDVHHKLEEDVLFPDVADHPQLRAGGPMCTYYWGIEMDLSPKSAAQELLRRLYKKNFMGQTEYTKFSWLQEGSPLSIPLSDHALSAELAYAIRQLSQEPDGEMAREFLDPLKAEYIRLLRAHIDKEDNCLFVLCENLLRKP